MKFLREYTISAHAPAGGATSPCPRSPRRGRHFYSRPCGRGDGGGARAAHGDVVISTHAPAGGATVALSANALREVFLLTPLREGRLIDFRTTRSAVGKFLLTPLREGRRDPRGSWARPAPYFYSRPCGRGDVSAPTRILQYPYFYSRPCGRGDQVQRSSQTVAQKFLLTPLREGRLVSSPFCVVFLSFLLTPLREGRRRRPCGRMHADLDFYSRPCGRGDLVVLRPVFVYEDFYSRPCGRGDARRA